MIEALDHYVKYHDKQLATGRGYPTTTPPIAANDQLYLEAIKKDFEKYRDQLVEQRDGINADA